MLQFNIIFVTELDKGTVQQAEPSDEAAQGAVGGEGRFKEGDSVKIEIDVDLLRTIEKGRGSWNEMMGQVRSLYVFVPQSTDTQSLAQDTP